MIETIDAAFPKFEQFVNTGLPTFQHTLLTEADVRMKIIDPIFITILGWSFSQIFTESEGGGYLDYRFTIEDFSRLVVEAKRDQRDLGIDSDRAGRFYKLNGPVFHSPDAKEGLNQAIRYCAYKNSELACVTNGRQWIIFRGNRLGDGRDTLDGMACVFGSLEAVKSKFKLFYELLSQDSVTDFLYRAHFQEAEGRPIQTSSFRKALRTPNSSTLIKIDKIYVDIDRVMISFFRNLSGDKDSSLLFKCFVNSRESDLAEYKLVRISEELYNRVATIRTQNGKEIEDAISRVKEIQRNEFVLIIGTKGSGKSTFMERFFKFILSEDLANQCTLIRVNLADSEGDSTTVIKWLNDYVLGAAEKAVFPNGYPSYEDLQAMFFDECKRWAESSFRDLYEKDKMAFRIRFGEHIERRREERPSEYVTRLIHHVVHMRHKIPCLVFDNADHFSIEFQERVFQYARAIYEKELCLVLVPITDKTSWQLSRQGALQSFYSESLFLPTPTPKAVLERRIVFLEELLSREKTESGTGYFIGRGIELSISNLTAFTNCLQDIFIRTGDVAEWIGNLANYDIRRCLDLTRDVVSSPHIKADELLKAFIDKSTVIIDPEVVRKAIILGKYDIYPVGQHKFVQNVFGLTTEGAASPLLALRILQFLYDIHYQDVDGESSYVPVERVISYLAAINFDAKTTALWLDAMLKTGLCLSYDPTITSLDVSSRIELSPSGRQHLWWGRLDWVYLEAMMEVTPIIDQDVYRLLDEFFSVKPPGFRQKALAVFLRYLVSEDSKYCHIPSHGSYKTQIELAQFLLNNASDGGPLYERQVNKYNVRSGTVNYFHSNSTVVICHAGTRMLPLDQA
jgi:energy-coupling factor transporter ATP-binding protein EcfA2